MVKSRTRCPSLKNSLTSDYDSLLLQEGRLNILFLKWKKKEFAPAPPPAPPAPEAVCFTGAVL